MFKCSSLTVGDRSYLMDPSITLRQFEKGQVIFREGSVPGEVYLIKRGEVEISKVMDGEHMTLKRLGVNEIFGEMALIDQSPRSATATALEVTECYVLDKHVFEKRVKEMDPFMRGIYRIMASTIREMNEHHLQCSKRLSEMKAQAIPKSTA